MSDLFFGTDLFNELDSRYANGCLSVSVGKQEASKPRGITVQ